MKTRNSALFALGLAAAMLVGGMDSASAQRTRTRARSTRRIPVRKDVPQPVARVDTVTVTRVDTVTVRRTDTVTTTVMRYDTVTRMVYPPLQRLPGFFIGLGAGADIPMNNIRIAVKDSYAGQAQIGVFPGLSPLGIRADVTYGQLGARDTDCKTCTSPKMLTGGADLILRAPLDRSSKLNPVLYVFGGGGIARFSDVDARQTALLNNGANPLVPYFHNESKGYYDFGPGVDFSVGGLHLYAEGRYMTVLTRNKNTHLFPVYGGIKLY